MPFFSGAGTGARYSRSFFWLVFACMFFLQLWGKPGAELFFYDRAAVLEGQWWRLLSAHFIHLNWRHFVVNALAFFMLARFLFLFSDLLPVTGAMLFSMLGVDAGLLLFKAEIHWYAGMSGVLHGMFMAASGFLFLRNRLAGAGLMLLLVLKLGWEQLAGALPGSGGWMGIPVVSDAHLYGAAGGAVFLVFLALRRGFGK